MNGFPPGGYAALPMRCPTTRMPVRFMGRDISGEKAELSTAMKTENAFGAAAANGGSIA
jgi:hypothetical protein